MSRDAADLIWSNFFQFSYNSYTERMPDDRKDFDYNPYLTRTSHLLWDQKLWEDLTQQIVDAGGNQVIFSLGDGIRYDSHPEIAVDGAWTPSELKSEIARLKALGIELVPKLNFSTAHDLWLGDYHRMVSTPTYYQVCSDLIAEVVDIFDNPPLFHLGYDEEIWVHQAWYEYVVLRQGDLWWRDFLWFVAQVEGHGARPWIWSDYIWNHTDLFLDRMPKSVIQSNWYYWENWDLNVDRASALEKGLDLTLPPGPLRTKSSELQAYFDLEAGKFDQIPAASIDRTADSFPETVRFAQKHLPSKRTLGFMQTTWRPMIEEFRDQFELGIEMMAEGRRLYDPNGWARED